MKRVMNIFRNKGHPVAYVNLKHPSEVKLSLKDQLHQQLGIDSELWKAFRCMSLTEYRIEENFRFLQKINWKRKKPIIIVDNANIFAISEDGKQLLNSLHHLAKEFADSSRATIIFVTSEGPALPLITRYTNTGGLNSLQLHELPDPKVKLVFQRSRSLLHPEWPPLKDEVVNVIITIFGGNLRSLSQIVSTEISAIPSQVRKITNDWKAKIKEDIKIAISSIANMAEELSIRMPDDMDDRILRLARAVYNAVKDGKFLPELQALKIFSADSAEKSVDHSGARAKLSVMEKIFWDNALEIILATNMLGRRGNGKDMELQYRSYRFVWEEILYDSDGTGELVFQSVQGLSTFQSHLENLCAPSVDSEASSRTSLIVSPHID